MKKLLAVIALTIRHRCPSSCPGGGGLHRHLRRISMQPVESNAGPLVRLSPSRRRVPRWSMRRRDSSSFLAVRPPLACWFPVVRICHPGERRSHRITNV